MAVYQNRSPEISNSLLVKKQLSLHQLAFYHIFVFSVLLNFSPVKSLAYLTPIIAVVWFFFITKSGVLFRNVIMWLGLWGLVVSLHMIFNTDYVIHSAFLFLVTYSSFMLLIAIPSHKLKSQILLKKIRKLILWIVLFEASIGLIQAIYGFVTTGTFDSTNGDHVEGTIHIWLAPSRSFSNPMFATNMTFLLLFLVTFVLITKKHKFIFLLGCCALMLASVIHALLFLFVAMVVSIIFINGIRLPKSRTAIITIFVAGFAILASMFFLRNNVSNIAKFYNHLITIQTPRARVIVDVFTEMSDEYPLMPVFGLGPGQFSSRASLIGTGLFFGGPEKPRPLPFIPQVVSEPAKTFLLDEWLIATSEPSRSSSRQPLFSWLSIYTELGIVGILAILFSLVFILFRIRRQAQSYNTKIAATVVTTGVLFLFFLGYQENYWEVPQAIVTGSLILKVLYANIANFNKLVT